MDNEFYGEDFDEEIVPLNKVIDLKEAFTHMFNGNWVNKFLIVMVLIIPAIVYQISAPNLSSLVKNNIWSAIGMVVAVLAMFVIIMLCGIILQGYFTLYAHDRALDKNAQLRDLMECLPDAFFAGVKSIILGIVIFLAVGLASIIPYLLSSVLTSIIPPLGILLMLATALVSFCFIIFLSYKIYPSFIKDLNLSSIFKMKKAFKFCKEVHFGKLNLAVVIIATVGIAITCYVTILLMGFILGGLGYFLKASGFFMTVAGIMGGVLGFVGQWYVGLLWANVFGQFAYNAIEQNMMTNPETLPKEINTDKVATTVAAVALFLIYAIFIIVPALVIPSLFNKQADAAINVKMKKAINDYEKMTSVYMIEHYSANVKDMMGNNCEHAESYLKIDKKYGDCKFKTIDGIYWEFDGKTGNATISDNPVRPKKTFKVGVCYDGTPNCQKEYQETYDFVRSRSKKKIRGLFIALI